MTFDQILLLYIYQHKKISLNLFGTIELEGAIPDADAIRKEKQLTIDGLKFTFNPNVTTDEAFIHFYASEKGRIIPLSASDIEAQLLMARQIVNIGNPYEIAGLGKIVKMDNGKLTMVPGYFTIPPVSGSGRPAVLKERVQQAPLPKTENREEKQKNNPKAGLWVVITGAVLIIALLVWAVFKFLLPMMQVKEPQTETSVLPVTPDTTVTQPVTLARDTIITLDSAAMRSWKAYIGESAKRQFAEDKLKRYRSFGHQAEMESPDSNRFLIFIPLETAIKDTARQRDSLSRFFGYPVSIVPKNP